MGFNNLRFQIIIRIIAIALTIYLFVAMAESGVFSLTVILIFSLAVAQVVGLIKLVDNTNRQIVEFFDSIKKNDLSGVEKKLNKDEYSAFLYEQFRMVLDRLKNSKLTRDEHQHYLTTIVQHVGIGLITFDEDGNIQIMNIAAKRLLKTENIKNINDLKIISEDLVKNLWELKTGGSALLTVGTEGEERQLSVYVIELTMGGKNFKLVSLQNIRSELEEMEMEAWQKLVRVLTHEIMNSVTPISSLANTVEEEIARYLEQEKDSDSHRISKDDLEDIYLGVQTIQRRSDGLIRFVNDFRSLTHTPEPRFKMVQVSELFSQISVLLKHELESNDIHFVVAIEPEDLTMNIDPELIQQVLINLIKNAIQALDGYENKTIELRAYRDGNSKVLMVKDNGPGIEEEAQSKIFIPFYTTKKSGSGIGLSLSRQIMRKHKATIMVKSKIDQGTQFILRF